MTEHRFIVTHPIVCAACGLPAQNSAARCCPVLDCPLRAMPQLACCAGKEAFSDKAMARRVIDSRRAKAKRPGAGSERRKSRATIEPYRCPICHAWHIGSRHTPKRNRP